MSSSWVKARSLWRNCCPFSRAAGLNFSIKFTGSHFGERTEPSTALRHAGRSPISISSPGPAGEAVSIERYLETWRLHHQAGSISIITARGCPYDCRWCSHAVFGKTHRRRKPDLVVDELEDLLGRYNPDMLWIADDVFTIHHGWLAEFAGEMRRRGIRIPFECISRADRVNPRVADLLADLGCFRIWIGSESGSQRVLDAMERGVTVEEVQTAVELCKSQRHSDRNVPHVGLRGRGTLGYRSDGTARPPDTTGHVPDDRGVPDWRDRLF